MSILSKSGVSKQLGLQVGKWLEIGLNKMILGGQSAIEVKTQVLDSPAQLNLQVSASGNAVLLTPCLWPQWKT